MTAATLPMTDDQTPPERLGFIIVVATAMHLALILGITFAAPEPSVKLPNLEITLAQYQSKDAPKNADYLANTTKSAVAA